MDAEQRRLELAEAVWRVVRRDGLPHASVRNVAREAGMSMGALRHWFGTQDELLSFAMTLVMARARVRAETVARTAGGSVRARVHAVLEETLPLDDDRRAEAEVWLAFIARTLVDPALAEVRDRFYVGLRELTEQAVAALVATGETRSALDVGVEADRLAAVLDGLALQALTRPLDTGRVRSILRAHLDELVGRTGRRRQPMDGAARQDG